MQNLQAEMEKTVRSLPKGTPLLLHACCGPCSVPALLRLAPHFSLTVFFCNPNIFPRDEYARRAEALRLLLAAEPAGSPPRLLEAEWDHGAFLEAVRGLEGEAEGGARCAACFRLRISAAARAAADMGIRWVGSTLSAGANKNAALLYDIGREQAALFGLCFLPADLKKKDGARQSAAASERYGLYRQNYCGCEFSMR